MPIDVHIRNTVETDAIAAFSGEEGSSSGSRVPDIEFTGFAVSNVLSSCCSVSESLNSDIPFFYLWYTESAVIANLGVSPLVLFPGIA